MKILLRDLVKLGIIFVIWYLALQFCSTREYWRVYESIKYFPFHLVITVGYYAVVSVCYKILFIRDCEEEHKELLDEIEEGRKFFIAKNIKYN